MAISEQMRAACEAHGFDIAITDPVVCRQVATLIGPTLARHRAEGVGGKGKSAHNLDGAAGLPVTSSCSPQDGATTSRPPMSSKNAGRGSGSRMRPAS